ncbi:MAG: hypothetical protein AAGF94_10740 [Pseudomonadota bacterium]
MIRPELIQSARRWRETLSGLGLALLGLWAGLGASGILSILGWIGLVAGLALAAAGIQRGRFRAGAGEGPGVVSVTEGQISYYGPLDGGTVAHDLLTELRFDPRSSPPVWVFAHENGAPLHIPVTAAGADQLFDVFEQLPGLDMQHLLALRDHPRGAPTTLWRRPQHFGLVDTS